MVDSALRLLFERVSDASAEPEHIILGARLVERRSLKPATARGLS